jgi:pimeloyl-ACP methyl ester carboxylesterase
MPAVDHSPPLVVLKFGSSVLRTVADLPSVVSEIYRHIRAGEHVVAVVSAFAGETETSQSQQQKFPVTDVFSHIEIADGRIWLRPDGVGAFAGDLPEAEQKVVWATQAVPVPDLFDQKFGGTAWRTKPSWYIVASKDRTVHPDLERFVAKRMGATTYEVDSSHVPMLSNPDFVIDVIRAAAKAVTSAQHAA